MLGWLDIGHPARFYCLVRTAFAFALMSCVTENVRPHQAVGVVTLVSVIASIGLIFLGLYVIWTVPEHPVVEGFQGRYFLPSFPF